MDDDFFISITQMATRLPSGEYCATFRAETSWSVRAPIHSYFRDGFPELGERLASLIPSPITMRDRDGYFHYWFGVCDFDTEAQARGAAARLKEICAQFPAAEKVASTPAVTARLRPELEAQMIYWQRSEAAYMVMRPPFAPPSNFGEGQASSDPQNAWILESTRRSLSDPDFDKRPTRDMFFNSENPYWTRPVEEWSPQEMDGVLMSDLMPPAAALADPSGAMIRANDRFEVIRRVTKHWGIGHAKADRDVGADTVKEALPALEYVWKAYWQGEMTDEERDALYDECDDTNTTNGLELAHLLLMRHVRFTALGPFSNQKLPPSGLVELVRSEWLLRSDPEIGIPGRGQGGPLSKGVGLFERFHPDAEQDLEGGTHVLQNVEPGGPMMGYSPMNPYGALMTVLDLHPAVSRRLKAAPRRHELCRSVALVRGGRATPVAASDALSVVAGLDDGLQRAIARFAW